MSLASRATTGSTLAGGSIGVNNTGTNSRPDGDLSKVTSHSRAIPLHSAAHRLSGRQADRLGAGGWWRESCMVVCEITVLPSFFLSGCRALLHPASAAALHNAARSTCFFFCLLPEPVPDIMIVNCHTEVGHNQRLINIPSQSLDTILPRRPSGYPIKAVFVENFCAGEKCHDTILVWAIDRQHALSWRWMEVAHGVRVTSSRTFFFSQSFLPLPSRTL